MTFCGGSEDLCLLRWQNMKIRYAGSFGGGVQLPVLQYGIIRFSVFAKEFCVFVTYIISHYGRPSRFALIHFHALRLDDSASLLIPHNLSRGSVIRRSQNCT